MPEPSSTAVWMKDLRGAGFLSRPSSIRPLLSLDDPEARMLAKTTETERIFMRGMDGGRVYLLRWCYAK